MLVAFGAKSVGLNDVEKSDADIPNTSQIQYTLISPKDGGKPNFIGRDRQTGPMNNLQITTHNDDSIARHPQHSTPLEAR